MWPCYHLRWPCIVFHCRICWDRHFYFGSLLSYVLEYKQVCSLDLSFLPAIYWQRPLFSAKWVKECFTASAIGILVHVRCEVFWSRQHSKYHIAQKFGRPIKVWNVWCCDFWLNSNQDNRRLCYLSFETHLQTAAINGTLDWESSQHQV